MPARGSTKGSTAKKKAGASEENLFLSVQEILDAPDRVPEEMHVPEWGGNVELTPLSVELQGLVRDEATVAGTVDEGLFTANLLVYGITKPRFTKEHVQQLRQKNAGVVELIAERILTISKMNRGAVAAAEALFRALAQESL